MDEALKLWADSLSLEPDYAAHKIDGYPLVFSLKVRFVDIDLLGHVNNATYGTYFEEGRMDLLRVLYRTIAIPPSIVVGRLEMDFRRPLYLADEPVVAVRVGTISAKRFDLEYAIYTDELVCEGRTVQVWYDYNTGRSAEIPAAFVAALGAYQAG